MGYFPPMIWKHPPSHLAVSKYFSYLVIEGLVKLRLALFTQCFCSPFAIASDIHLQEEFVYFSISGFDEISLHFSHLQFSFLPSTYIFELKFLEHFRNGEGLVFSTFLEKHSLGFGSNVLRSSSILIRKHSIAPTEFKK